MQQIKVCLLTCHNSKKRVYFYTHTHTPKYSHYMSGLCVYKIHYIIHCTLYPIPITGLERAVGLRTYLALPVIQRQNFDLGSDCGYDENNLRRRKFAYELDVYSCRSQIFYIHISDRKILTFIKLELTLLPRGLTNNISEVVP